MSIIQIDHITKIFRDKNRTVTAVDDISFEVKRGEIFGLLGPNGAGKSTLIRILTTLLQPTAGAACVGTYDVVKEPGNVRQIIGVCPQNSTLDLELTAYENLDFYGRLVNVGDDVLDGRIRSLLEMAGLTEWDNAKVQTLSGGMRRKLEIVRAFIHHPLILFLDEPTIGLDPESRREVWHQITRLNQEQTTIILTTHYMDEAEKLCNRIAFVNRGRLISLDTLENLRQILPEGDLIEIGFEQLTPEALAAIRADSRIISAEVKAKTLHISARGGSRTLPFIIDTFDRMGIAITSIAIRSPSLEDVCIYLTGTGLDDAGPVRTGPVNGRPV